MLNQALYPFVHILLQRFAYADCRQNWGFFRNLWNASPETQSLPELGTEQLSFSAFSLPLPLSSVFLQSWTSVYCRLNAVVLISLSKISLNTCERFTFLNRTISDFFFGWSTNLPAAIPCAVTSVWLQYYSITTIAQNGTLPLQKMAFRIRNWKLEGNYGTLRASGFSQVDPWVLQPAGQISRAGFWIFRPASFFTSQVLGPGPSAGSSILFFSSS